jgi:hypothetical protein
LSPLSLLLLSYLFSVALFQVRETIFREFNSLSVLYNKPSASFIAPDHMFAKAPVEEVVAAAAQDDDRLLVEEEETGSSSSSSSSAGSAASSAAAAAAGSAPRAAPPAEEEDLLGLGFGSSAPSQAAAVPAPAAVSLVGSPQLDSAAFQSRWSSLAAAGSLSLRAQRLPSSTAEVEGWARSCGLATIASGDTGAALKWFFFCQDTQGAFALAEALLDKGNWELKITLKCDAPQNAHLAVQALRSAFANLPAA